MNLVALDDRMLFLVAAIANIEIKVSDVIPSSRVDRLETLFEFLIAQAMQSRKVIIVLQAVFLLPRRNVIAVIVCSAALVYLPITAQVLVAVGRVAWSAPFGSGKAQVDTFLALLTAFDGSLAGFRVTERCVSHQRLLCHYDLH